MRAPTQAVPAEAGPGGDALMARIGVAARAAARPLALAAPQCKTDALNAAAARIEQRTPAILTANRRDRAEAEGRGLRGAMLDRLTLTEERLAAVAEGVRAVAALPDPVGEVVAESIAEFDDPVGGVIAEWERPNGLRIQRVRVPLGVIGIIYESRPNVTADAGALCLKSGNPAILRGGSESFHTSAVLHECLAAGLTAPAWWKGWRRRGCRPQPYSESRPRIAKPWGSCCESWASIWM